MSAVSSSVIRFSGTFASITGSSTISDVLWEPKFVKETNILKTIEKLKPTNKEWRSIIDA